MHETSSEQASAEWERDAQGEGNVLELYDSTGALTQYGRAVAEFVQHHVLPEGDAEYTVVLQALQARRVEDTVVARAAAGIEEYARAAAIGYEAVASDYPFGSRHEYDEAAETRALDTRREQVDKGVIGALARWLGMPRSSRTTASNINWLDVRDAAKELAYESRVKAHEDGSNELARLQTEE